MPARVPARMPGQTRLPDCLSACRPASVSADDPGYSACRLDRKRYTGYL